MTDNKQITKVLTIGLSPILFLLLWASACTARNEPRNQVAEVGLEAFIDCLLNVEEMRLLGQRQVLWKWKRLVRCSNVYLTRTLWSGTFIWRNPQFHIHTRYVGFY